jgi:hypothetical protein
VWEEESVLSEYNSELTLSHLDTYSDYYPYMGQRTLRIRVSVSSRFSGSDDFYLTLEKIRSVIETLTKMHRDLTGTCEIKSMALDSDSYFKLEMVDNGHVSITGQLGSVDDDDYLKFKIYSDQTILTRLIQILQDMVTE